MSNYNQQWPGGDPNYNPQWQGGAPYFPPPPPASRPRSVTVLAIIGIIIGSLGSLGLVCGLMAFSMPMAGPNPYLKPLESHQALLIYTIVSYIVGGVLSVLLLVGSILSLRLRPFGRMALIVYGVVQMILTIVGQAITLLNLFPELKTFAQQQSSGAEPVARFATTLGLVGAALMLVYDISLIFFMTRPHVKAAFMSGPGFPIPAQPIYTPPTSP